MALAKSLYCAPSNMGLHVHLSIPFRIVFVQLLSTIGLTLAYLPFDEGGLVKTYSVLLGGVTSMLPSAFMAWHMSRSTVNTGAAFKSLIYGEIGKLALTAFLFIVVFVFIKPLDVLFFFSSLVLSMMCHVFVPLYWSTVEKSKQDLVEPKASCIRK
ncbi:MAG: F0F1-type ATP synthase assembly protein I [Candidatus Azotimanducaceae bacterium]|jgi:F0F1-type ATP synthase assembly protein I